MRTMSIDDVACPDARIMRHEAKVHALNTAANLSHLIRLFAPDFAAGGGQARQSVSVTEEDCEKHNDIKGKRYDFMAQRPVANAPLFPIDGVIVRF
jgi:hypothetical protein